MSFGWIEGLIGVGVLLVLIGWFGLIFVVDVGCGDVLLGWGILLCGVVLFWCGSCCFWVFCGILLVWGEVDGGGFDVYGDE